MSSKRTPRDSLRLRRNFLSRTASEVLGEASTRSKAPFEAGCDTECSCRDKKKQNVGSKATVDLEVQSKHASSVSPTSSKCACLQGMDCLLKRKKRIG